MNATKIPATKRTMSLGVSEERLMQRALELYRRANERHRDNNKEIPSVRAMCSVEVGEARAMLERLEKRRK